MSQQGKNYDAWKIDKKDFPKNEVFEKKAKFLLNYAITAPSALNTQPWFFEIGENKITVSPDLSRSLPEVADKNNRLLYISLGCVVKNLKLASTAFGFETTILYTKDNGFTKAEITYNNFNSDLTDSSVLDTLLKRATNRSLYLGKKIGEKLLKQIEIVLSKDKDLEIIIVQDDNKRKRIIDLVKKVDFVIWNDSDFKTNHLSWVRHNLTSSGDGMPGNTVGIPLLPSFFAKIVIRNPKFAKLQAKKNSNLLNSTPYFGFILSQTHDPKTWIKVGEAFEEISIIATKNGLATALMAEITEVGNFYKETMAILNTNLRPQLFFRLGYPSKQNLHSPRRPVEKLIKLPSKANN